MGKSNKHIEMFEELLKVLLLKKRFNSENLHSLITSIKIIQIPDNQMVDKSLLELEKHYKSIKPKRKFRWLFLLFVPVLFIGFIFLFPIKQEKKTEIQKTELQQSSYIENDSVQKIDFLQTLHNEMDSLLKKKPIKKEPEILMTKKNETTKVLSIDTLQEEIKKADTLAEKKLIYDTVSQNKDANPDSIVSGIICYLPEKYSFYFQKRSSVLEDSNNIDLTLIAQKIENCQNLRTIQINAFYLRRFLVFGNKKIALERIDTLSKQLKKNGVSAKSLRKKQIELIRIKKTNYDQTFERLDVILQ